MTRAGPLGARAVAAQEGRGAAWQTAGRCLAAGGLPGVGLPLFLQGDDT